MSHQKNLIWFAIFVLGLLIFTSCGLAPSTPPTPVIQTVVVLQTVVVTATPPPAPIAASKTVTPTVAAPSGPPAPSCAKSDCTKTGPAIALKGNATTGQKLFTDNCQKCHGPQGKKGIDNPGSTDGVVPVLNPIDPTFSVKDRKAFATQIDVFIEHGSTPDGPSPKNVMDAWGDQKKLTSQQIADVIAYVLSLNP